MIDFLAKCKLNMRYLNGVLNSMYTSAVCFQIMFGLLLIALNNAEYGQEAYSMGHSYPRSMQPVPLT